MGGSLRRHRANNVDLSKSAYIFQSPVLMKASDFFPFLLLLVFQAGCNTTTQLTLENDAPRFASIMGVEASEIQFICFGDFSLYEKPKRKKTVTLDGIIALTDSDLHLIIPQRYLFSDKAIRIPVDETEAIADTSYQIQLMHQGDRIVLELRDADTLDLIKQNYQTVMDFYKERGVPEYDAGRSGDIEHARSRTRAWLSDRADWAPINEGSVGTTG